MASSMTGLENRETFFARLEPHFPPSAIREIRWAYMAAKYGHRAQRRKELDESGEQVRYFEHLRRVAIILIDVARIVDPIMVAASLLHDSFEDTRELTPEMVEHVFGSEVVSIVKVLSKTPKDGYLERFALCTDWRPYVIKACDRLDNLRTLGQAMREFRAKQVAETREKYFPLFDRMLALTPPAFIQRVTGLRDAVRAETERQAILLEVQSQ